MKVWLRRIDEVLEFLPIEAIPDAQGILVVPPHVPHALSTDGQALPD